MSDDQPTYDDHDDGVIANNIFNELCRRDREDRKNGKQPADWHDITALVEELKAYDNRIDVAYLAEEHLLDRNQFIERDPHNQNVRLSELGRKNCDEGIDIPPSTNQVRIKL